MSTELERLEEQIRLAFEGPAWHGPSVLEALQGLSAEDAWAHPVPGAHSAWELVLHLAGTYGLVMRRLGGEDAQLAPHEDWPAPPSPSGKTAWSDAIRSLRDLNAEARAAVLRSDRGGSTSRCARPCPTRPTRSSSASPSTTSTTRGRSRSCARRSGDRSRPPSA